MINNGGVHHRQETESGGCLSRHIVVFKPIVRPYYSPHEISLIFDFHPGDMNSCYHNIFSCISFMMTSIIISYLPHIFICIFDG